MKPKSCDAVTGAFGYTGKYITARLLSQGREVITLTSKPLSASPFGERVRAVPFSFDAPSVLAANLRGVDTLYNTYWVRFDHGRASYSRAVENTSVLLRAALRAGVRRVVHISISNPDANPNLPYFRGKALLEAEVRQIGISYAILRPTVIFGREDILINNIAWLLRRLPLFAVPGDGQYRLQPIYVEDLAALALKAGSSESNQVIDAVGPETYTFQGLVELLRTAVNSSAALVHLPPMLSWRLSQLVGLLVGDVILTADEVIGLMDNLLISDQTPTGKTRLSEWVTEHADVLGAHYAHELKRHYA